MKKSVFLAVIILLTLTMSVSAFAEAEVPERAKGILGDITEENALDLGFVLKGLGERMAAEISKPIKAALKNGTAVLACAIFASLGETVTLKKTELDAAKLAGVLGITVTAGVGITSIIGSLGEFIADLRVYSAALLPTVASAAAAAGSPIAASGSYAASTLFMNAVLTATERIIMPLIMTFVAIAAASAAFGGSLRGVILLINKAIRWLLIGIAGAFTAYLGTSNVISKAADEAAVKAARTALSTLVPVVGRTISDASEAVASGFGIVKNTAGVFGIIVMLALSYGPIVSAGTNYIAFKIASALSETVAGPEITRLISDIGTAIGYATAAAAVSALVFFISITSFIGMVAP